MSRRSSRNRIASLLLSASALAGCGRLADEPSCRADIVDIAVAPARTCVLNSKQEVRCFGDYPWYDAGAPPWSIEWTKLGGSVVELEAGRVLPCALLAGGTVVCGDQDLGLEAAETFDLPAPVIDISSGTAATWMVFEDGTLGRRVLIGDELETFALPWPARGAEFGRRHGCVLSGDGKVACFGQNYCEFSDEICGQVGVPNLLDVNEFVELPLPAGAVGVDPGENHTCAWFEDGGYLCWGADDIGQLGNGPGSERIGDDESLAGLSSGSLDGAIVQLSVGPNGSCARLDDGAVRCWGDELLADPTADLLTAGIVEDPLARDPVPLPEPAVDIGLDGHACALGESGAVYCWGGPPLSDETSSWDEDHQYIDPETGMVRAMAVRDPGCR